MEKKLYLGEGLSGKFTRFGTLSSSLNHSLTHVRNIGFKNGVKLNKCDNLDAAACVIGADTWMMLSGGSGVNLTNPVGCDAESRKVLSNIILRGCGHGVDYTKIEEELQFKINDELLEEIAKEQLNQEKWLKREKIITTSSDEEKVFHKVLSDYSEAENNSLACYRYFLSLKYY